MLNQDTGLQQLPIIHSVETLSISDCGNPLSTEQFSVHYLQQYIQLSCDFTQWVLHSPMEYYGCIYTSSSKTR